MAERIDVLLNGPVRTPSGQTVTTTDANIFSSNGAVANTANVIVGEVGSFASGVITGAVGQAIAPVVDVAKKASQVYDLVTNPSLGGALALLGRGFPPYRNELDQFASYNYIFTLGCLTSLELNFPLSYRTLGPAVKIIKSGGTGGNKIPTIYETDGMTEFFIEDVSMKTHCAPNENSRTSNAMLITFKVIEPYSMGQFFHNLRTAALVTGHPNYLNAPYLLSVKFVGYDDDGNVKEPFFSQRHIPIRLIKSEMKVTEAGAEYLVEAAPYNEIALMDSVNQVKTDITLTGRTVKEVLQTGAKSLAARLNNTQIELVEAKQKPAADYYIFSFPDVTDNLAEAAGGGLLGSLGATVGSAFGDRIQQLYESITGDIGGGQDRQAQIRETLSELSGSTVLGSPLADQLKAVADQSTNAIGESTINLSGTGWGPPNDSPPFPGANFVENLDDPGTFVRGRISYNPDVQEFTFKSMTSITDIIEEVLLSSQYARDWARQAPNPQGRTDWFKIHTHVYNGSSLLGGLITGESPKIYVYRIVRYTVDASVTSGAQTGFFNELAKQSQAVKAYNYIYTGQNTDIIDFDLTFNQTYFTGITQTRGQRQRDNVVGGANSVNQPEQQPSTTTNQGSTTAQNADAAGAARVVETAGSSTGTREVSGGGGSNDSETAMARDMHDMVINTGNDLLKVDLTIHGDPYFISDAGLGNYLGIPNPVNQAITVDGAMNPINGQVTVILNFRTPVDYDDETGFVKYPLGGFLPIAMFSGIYLVILVESNFRDGKFTQTLTLNRLRNQDLTVEKLASAIVDRISSFGSSITNAIGLGGEDTRIEPQGQASQPNTNSAGEG